MTPLPPRDSRRLGALGGALAGALGAASAWGFTVDDALITARVAHHIALGLGHRFNPTGPSVDCVTPLGFPYLLAPFAADGPWPAMTWASIAGGVVWVAAAARLGVLCTSRCWSWRALGLGLVLATSLPLGAWAVSGMETGFIMALGVLALHRGFSGALAAGVAAALRPELVPWAVTLAFGTALAHREPLSRRGLALLGALGPALAVAGVRAAVFGWPAPLGVFAKPSDFVHGLRYAAGLCALSGPFSLLVATRSYRELSRADRALAAALVVHVLALIAAGGDWMPFWRLAMPVVPGVFALGASLAASSRGWACALRFSGALACAAVLWVFKGADARAVREQRARVMRDAAPLLDGAARIAALDIGWVGALGPAHVLDLAGVTDPEVAHLPGGHTSKRLPSDFLERHEADAVILLARVNEGIGASSSGASGPNAGAHLDPSLMARQVEARVLGLRGAGALRLAGTVPLTARQRYLILRRVSEASSP